MASYTPNYNLKKPAGTDVVDIADLNGNMDIIDTQLNSLNSKLTTQVITFANIADSIKENVTGDLSKNGNRCDLYLAFANASMSDGQNLAGILKTAYRPSMTYSIGLIYSKTSPYMPIGTVWVYSTGYVYAYCSNGSSAGYAYVSYNL